MEVNLKKLISDYRSTVFSTKSSAFSTFQQYSSMTAFRKAMLQMIKKSPERNHDLVFLTTMCFVRSTDIYQFNTSTLNHDYHIESNANSLDKTDYFYFLGRDTNVFFKLLKVINVELDFIEKCGEEIKGNVMNTIHYLWRILGSYKGRLIFEAQKNGYLDTLKTFASHTLNGLEHQGTYSTSTNKMPYELFNSPNSSLFVINKFFLPVLEEYDFQAYQDFSWQFFFQPFSIKKTEDFFSSLTLLFCLRDCHFSCSSVDRFFDEMQQELGVILGRFNQFFTSPFDLQQLLLKIDISTQDPKQQSPSLIYYQEKRKKFIQDLLDKITPFVKSMIETLPSKLSDSEFNIQGRAFSLFFHLINSFYKEGYCLEESYENFLEAVTILSIKSDGRISRITI